MPTDPRTNRWPVQDGSHVTRCRSCGQLLTWGETSTGKRIPLSMRTAAVEVPDGAGGTKVLEPSVVEIDGERWALPHFVDCPQAGAWRRKE